MSRPVTTKLRAVLQGGPGREGATEALGVPASVVLTLPSPPSVNEAFRNVPGKGRCKTQVYMDWAGHAGWRLKEQRPTKLHGYVVVVISVERGSLRADIDNRIKLLLDLLVEHQVIDDDRFIVGLAAAWAPAASKLARVMVLPADDYGFNFQLASDRSAGGWYLTAPQHEPEDFPDGTLAF